VSRRIAELESFFGVQLFERTTRSMRLTEAGHRLVQESRLIIEAHERAYEIVKGNNMDVSGVLRVSTSQSVGQYIIAPRLAELRRKYPRLTIELNLSNRRVDLVEEGFDLAVRVGYLEDSQVVSIPLMTTESALYASFNYLVANHRILSLDDLSSHGLWMMSDLSSRQYLELTSGSDVRRIKVVSAGEMSDFTALAQAARNDAGVALLPRFVAKSKPFNTLVNVLPKWRTERHPINIVAPSRRGISRKARAFIELLQS
jgi:LysR family transcriptional regulator AphB